MFIRGPPPMMNYLVQLLLLVGHFYAAMWYNFFSPLTPFCLYLLILWNTLAEPGSSLILSSVPFPWSNTNSFSWDSTRSDVPSRFEQYKVNSTVSTLRLVDPTPCTKPIWFWQESLNAVSLSRTSKSPLAGARNREQLCAAVNAVDCLPEANEASLAIISQRRKG